MIMPLLRNAHWPRLCRLRLRPRSPGSPASATRTGTGWWCAMGYHRPREVLTGAGAVEVVAPRVNVLPPRSWRVLYAAPRVRAAVS